MPLLGAHMSVAGGLHKAAHSAAALGMETVQIFTHSPSQWAIKPLAAANSQSSWQCKQLTDEDVRLFREAIQQQGLRSPIAHDSYLINLASPDDALWDKSVAAFTAELERAEALGLEGVVMHPGSHLEGTVEAGLARVAAGIRESLRRTSGGRVGVWLETTAGQGTNLGHRFEHLQSLLEQIPVTARLGVCVDTCHIFAGGYGLQTAAEYTATFEEFDDRIGLARIRAFHLNDSKKGRGSRVDRHEHIGEGQIGVEAFRLLLNDVRFATLPMYLETKKERREGEEMDAVNLRTLRGLLQPTPVKPRSKPQVAKRKSRT